MVGLNFPILDPRFNKSNKESKKIIKFQKEYIAKLRSYNIPLI